MPSDGSPFDRCVEVLRAREALAQKNLRKGEDERLEYKDSFPPSGYLGTLISAFGYRGGLALIGVNDDGEPIGLTGEEIALRNTRAVIAACEPAPNVEHGWAYLTQEQRYVYVINVLKSNTPVRAPDGRFYIRDGEENRRIEDDTKEPTQTVSATAAITRLLDALRAVGALSNARIKYQSAAAVLRRKADLLLANFTESQTIDCFFAYLRALGLEIAERRSSKEPTLRADLVSMANRRADELETSGATGVADALRQLLPEVSVTAAEVAQVVRWRMERSGVRGTERSTSRGQGDQRTPRELLRAVVDLAKRIDSVANAAWSLEQNRIADFRP